MQSDVLTLQRTPTTPVPTSPNGSGGVAVAEAPPHAWLRLRPDPKRRPRSIRPRPKTAVVRHITDHRVVALIEIVSKENKDRRDHVRDLAWKIVQCIESGVHVMLLDVLPVTRYGPHGIHGAVWGQYDTQPYDPPADGPLTLASYIGRPGDPEAFLEPIAVGQALPDMPLFLSAERYVNVPLEASYLSAFGDMPAFTRELLEATTPPQSAGG